MIPNFLVFFCLKNTYTVIPFVLGSDASEIRNLVLLYSGTTGHIIGNGCAPVNFILIYFNLHLLKSQRVRVIDVKFMSCQYTITDDIT